MIRRKRLLVTAGAASIAAMTGAITVAGYTDSVSGRFGSLRPVVVTTASIEGGRKITPREVAGSMQIRRIPSRFAPAGVLTDPSGAIGLQAVTDVPAGAYLSSHLIAPPGRTGATGRSRPMRGLHRVEVTVEGAGAIVPQVRRFDVLLTPLDDRGGFGPTRVAARSAVVIARAPVEQADPSSARVTLGVSRRQAVDLIDAEARGARLTLLATKR